MPYQFEILCEDEPVQIIVWDDITLEFVDYDLDEAETAVIMEEAEPNRCTSLAKEWESSPLRALVAYASPPEVLAETYFESLSKAIELLDLVIEIHQWRDAGAAGKLEYLRDLLRDIVSCERNAEPAHYSPRKTDHCPVLHKKLEIHYRDWEAGNPYWMRYPYLSQGIKKLMRMVMMARNLLSGTTLFGFTAYSYLYQVSRAVGSLTAGIGIGVDEDAHTYGIFGGKKDEYQALDKQAQEEHFEWTLDLLLENLTQEDS